MPGVETMMGPLAGLGFGGCTGAAVGYAAKKLTKMLALLLGLLFIALQLLAYYGFVHVDWVAVQTTAEKAINGDAASTGQRLWEVLAANLPWGGGFAAGFVIGFKLG